MNDIEYMNVKAADANVGDAVHVLLMHMKKRILYQMQIHVVQIHISQQYAASITIVPLLHSVVVCAIIMG